MTAFYQTSIGRKQLAALTGLALSGFLIAHLSGNLLIYSGHQSFNDYAKGLSDLGPVLWVARLGLLGTFVVHIFLVMKMVMENKAARPVPYAVQADQGKPSLAVKTMPYTGIFLLVYVLWHISQFTFGTHSGSPATVGSQDLGLYGLVYNEFLKPLNSLFYIAAMVVLGLHTSHGIQSAFQTFGFNHPTHSPRVKKISYAFGIVVGLGFASIPLYIMIVNPMGA